MAVTADRYKADLDIKTVLVTELTLLVGKTLRGQIASKWVIHKGISPSCVHKMRDGAL